MQGKGQSGVSSEDELRVPLDVAEQRGFGSPRRDLYGGCPRALGESVGRQEVVSGSPKRRRKNWIKTKKLRNYVVGEDLAWESVLNMAKCTLVGRVLGRNFTKKTVQDWATASWGTQLGYAPVVDMLNRGWFAVNLEKAGDLSWIQNKCWHIDHSPVLLKPWSPLFDAIKERVDIVPVWVRLPALPLHFWDLYHFRRIGDMLGTFLEVDLSFLETREKKVARILVNINLREGLAESINLEWGPVIIPQILDYENVPFRCRRCHVYGHPASACTLSARPQNGIRRKDFEATYKGSHEKVAGSSGSAQTSVDEVGNNPSVEELLFF